MNILVLIDFDNVLKSKNNISILDIVIRVLNKLQLVHLNKPGTCHARVYHGWYENETFTRVAQDTYVQIQRDFPHIFHLSQTSSTNVIKLTAQLAQALLEEPGQFLYNTFRRKGKARSISVKKPADIGCIDSDCFLPLFRNALKTGRCPKNGCSIIDQDLVYRSEQKLVDAMLTCDLIHAGIKGYDLIVLVSEDDDFLPPLRTLLLRRAPVIRFSPNSNNQRLPITVGSITLEEKEL